MPNRLSRLDMSSSTRRDLNRLMESFDSPGRRGGGRGRGPASTSYSASPRDRGSIRGWLSANNTRGNGSREGVRSDSTSADQMDIDNRHPNPPTSQANQQRVSVSEEVGVAGSSSVDTPSQVSTAEATERNKRTVAERSPQTDTEVRNTRRRLNEFDLGEDFTAIDEELRKKMDEVTSKAPEEVRNYLRDAMTAVAEAVTGMMNSISDGVRQERLERETLEDRTEDKLGKLEEEVKEQRVILDSLTEVRIRSRVKESIKEMESKVAEAECAIKVLDIDIGRETGDKREIVRKTIDSIRSYVREDSVGWLDRIMKRTRIVILGRGTVRQDRNSGVEYTVPTLFQCRDRRDAEDLDFLVREAGWFPSFHWPREIIEMVNHARDEVRQQGYAERDYYVRVRPERREGGLMLKAEVKPKAGGRFTLKGLWSCPPLHRMLWDSVPDLMRSKLTEQS